MRAYQFESDDTVWAPLALVLTAVIVLIMGYSFWSAPVHAGAETRLASIGNLTALTTQPGKATVTRAGAPR